MKYKGIIAVMLLVCSLGGQVYGKSLGSDSDFITDFGDVPLMKGLTELEDERVIFDTEAGTIAETVLVGKVSAADIQTFYAESLKQLGWEKIEAGHSASRWTFIRDKQVLSLRLFDSNGTKSLLVHLEPGK